jgi:hypothetical protein
VDDDVSEELAVSVFTVGPEYGDSKFQQCLSCMTGKEATA